MRHTIYNISTDNVITSRFDYAMNARERLSTVSEEGALKNSYTYYMSEQRIVKAVSEQASIHYHYDGEGRLKSDTDAAAGETILDYVWLGLTPIASFGGSYNPDGAANDTGSVSGTSNNDTSCHDEEITALEALITDRTERIDRNAARITELGELAVDKQSRIETNSTRINSAQSLTKPLPTGVGRIMYL